MSNIMTRPLYEIRQEHINIIQQIEENEGFLTPEIEEALQLTEEEFQSKAISYGYVYKSFEDTTAAIEKEISRLKLLLQKSVHISEVFKDRLAASMHQFSVEKIETPTLKLSFRKSESIEITDESKIPKEFIEEKVSEVISKTKIKAAIKEGLSVPGAELVINQNLQIK